MHCAVSMLDQTAIITIAKPFGWTSFPECSRALNSLKPSIKKLQIDLSDIDDLDNAGLGILLLMRQQASQKDLSLSLKAPPSVLRDILTVSQIDRLFEIDEGEEDDMPLLEIPD